MIEVRPAIFHESGVDPHWELQFNPPGWRLLRWIGLPNPILGATPNFNAHTSVFYGGLNYEFSLAHRFRDTLTHGLTKNLFLGGGLSLALHNGPLHKNKVDCRKKSDCGFGSPVLPRVAVEVGRNFGINQGISLFYDHMSHGRILSGENEGIDHIGLRYHFKSGNLRP